MKTCRGCGSQNLYEVLDLGHLPLAGDFKPVGEPNLLYPLAVDGCRKCGLLQVRETVDPAILFTSSYSYASSTIQSLVAHFEDYARSVALQPDERKRLLEIGCNDGVFLLPLRRVGYEVMGVEASENVAAAARGRGLDVRTGFLVPELAREIVASAGRFDVVTCSNVFAHNPDLSSFIEAVELSLAPDGEFWVEVHSAERLYADLQWDCFYHEHCFYWSIEALANVMAEHGFGLLDWSETPMHGGALRARFSRNVELRRLPPRLGEFEWAEFAVSSRRSRELVHDSVHELPLEYAYGAAGRAVTLINWAGLNAKFRFAVDGSPLRYGRAIPNSNIPIISESEFADRQRELNDWCFVSAHNYLTEIREKVSRLRPARTIKFVTPLPYVCIR